MEFSEGGDMKPPKGCCLPLEVPFLVPSFISQELRDISRLIIGLSKIENITLREGRQPV
jgi:hypothetical protein